MALAVSRLIFWHAMQPALTTYFVYFNWEAIAVHEYLVYAHYGLIGREIVYLLYICICVVVNPVFLLIDVNQSFKDKDSPAPEGGWQFLCLYIFAPEKFVALQAFSLGGLSLPDWFVLCAVYGSAVFDVSGLVALALWMQALNGLQDIPKGLAVNRSR
eukprot:COSAG01_NODE_21548_length_896_cov_14.331242_1_plen_158_part_00